MFSLNKSRLITALLALFVGAILLAAASAFFVNAWLHKPMNLQNEKVLAIQPGDTMGKIAYRLASDDVLNYPKLFILYAKFTEQTHLEVGEYRLPANITPKQFLSELRSGDVVTYSVTLVEGLTFKNFLEILKKQEKIVTTLNNEASSKTAFQQLKEKLKLDIEHPEGWFYPDTYQYVANTKDVDILLQAHKKMQRVLAEEWENKAKNLPYKNAYEALTMASIVEKETGVAYERPEIAGVFVRRLQKGMRLQTDPTIIYGLGDSYKGNIRRKHLRQPTPYNTYVIDGLPPTPIAMPGRDAIHAALHPKAGKTLFFVAKGDGSHQFSETLKQHNRAVQKYQIQKRAKNYRSAPASN